MVKFIRGQMSQEELLAQLAEEAVELSHAALKLRRAHSKSNPTPIPLGEAYAHLKEEVADVQLLLKVLGMDRHQAEYDLIGKLKLERWVNRLRGRG